MIQSFCKAVILALASLQNLRLIWYSELTEKKEVKIWWSGVKTGRQAERDLAVAEDLLDAEDAIVCSKRIIEFCNGILA